jgi:hypothetical protein
MNPATLAFLITTIACLVTIILDHRAKRDPA